MGAHATFVPTFVIVTAWNPAGTELCSDENVARNSGLRAAIRARGWRCLPAENRALDGSHVEPGFAILDVPPGEVGALAVRFGQGAVFVWDGREGRIMWLDRGVPGRSG